MDTKKLGQDKDKINILLTKLAEDFFEIRKLDIFEKRHIFSEIQKGILANKNNLRNLIIKEVKFTEKDAEKEVDRAYRTFALAEKHADYIVEKIVIRNGKRIIEKRIARGPLLTITPFSSPLSSPAHKIALGIMAGTSILFKPSHLAKRTGNALYRIITKVTKGKYVYFYAGDNERELKKIVSDERIGVISFTGGYETGKKIIKTGGVKKYHMELVGGNSSVIFAPEYKLYNDQLIEKILDGILAKNGQRCISIKHIFIPIEQRDFIAKIQDRLFSLKKKLQVNFRHGKLTLLGPLITTKYALHTETKVNEILQNVKKNTPCIAFERNEDYIFPTMYVINKTDTNVIKHILEYDLLGPILFIYFYKNIIEYEKVLAAFKNEYIRSGLQLSFYTEDTLSIKNISPNLFWGGIIINDIPTFRDEFMSFGGFGRSGLGKEGFFETINALTDPQVVVTNLMI